MLPRKHRLLAEKDFSRLLRSGRQLSAGPFGLKFAKNGLGASRIGFAVGVKVAKRAVVRNLLKRRLREITRKLLPAIAPGYDLLFMARPGSTQLQFKELEEVVRVLLARTGLLPRT